VDDDNQTPRVNGDAPADAVIAAVPSDSAPELEELTVTTNVAGWLTRAVIQDGHWQAEYAPRGTDRWQPLTVHPVDLIQQGVFVPAGDWQVRFRYRPGWVNWSLPIWALAWLLFAAALTRILIRRPNVFGGSTRR
jgi:hypothetical protein